MRRLLGFAVAFMLIAAFGGMPFHGTDVAELRPIEVVYVSVTDGMILVQTDTGDRGAGANLKNAFQDLRHTTPGTVFMETADYLLIAPDAVPLLTELCDVLRPGCKICIAREMPELKDVSAYLKAHELPVTLQDHRAGARTLPQLQLRKGRMYLVP